MTFSFNGQPLHFETGNFKGKSRFLPDHEYARALDCLVKACCDILIIEKGDTENSFKLLIGKRCVYPQKDYWYPTGGRMKPGESPTQAGIRIIKRELSLDSITKERFELVGHYSYLWELREQEPQNNGTADISCVLCIALTKEEVEKMVPNKQEYEGHKWVNVNDFLKEEFHPALKQSVKDYVQNQEFKKLQKAAQNFENISDQQLGKMFRNFVKK